MPLINCEVNLILTWSLTYVITNSTVAGRFTVTDTKPYVPVVTLSTQDNTKLIQQLKCDFKRTINWNKYQSDPKTYTQNKYLNHLIAPSFQGVNRLFALSFENADNRKSHSNYHLLKAGVKDGENIFDQPINNDFKTYENIRKIVTGQWDDYTTGYLLDYPYYKIIAINLSKQVA